jgi:hypothetical protein
VFTRRRTNISSSISKRRLAEKAEEDVKESRQVIADYKQQIEALEKEKAQALMAVNDRWGDLAGQSQDISLTPARKDVLIDAFGVAWQPFYVVQVGEEVLELPAFETRK